MNKSWFTDPRYTYNTASTLLVPLFRQYVFWLCRLNTPNTWILAGHRGPHCDEVAPSWLKYLQNCGVRNHDCELYRGKICHHKGNYELGRCLKKGSFQVGQWFTFLSDKLSDEVVHELELKSVALKTISSTAWKHQWEQVAYIKLKAIFGGQISLSRSKLYKNQWIEGQILYRKG